MAEVLSDKDLAGWWAFVAESEDSLGKETTLQFLATIDADRREIADRQAAFDKERLAWASAVGAAEKMESDQEARYGSYEEEGSLMSQLTVEPKPLSDDDIERIRCFHDCAWPVDQLLATIAADRREIARLRKVVDAARTLEATNWFKGLEDPEVWGLIDTLAALDNQEGR